jgi:predicted phosphodiesterase
MVRLQSFDEGYAVASNTALQSLIAAGRHRWFVGGHTHRRMVRRFGGLTVINPGTLRRDKDPCCAIVDLDKHVVQFFDASLVDDAPLRLLETVSLL